MSKLYVIVLTPKKWWKRSKYQLTRPLHINGHTVPDGFITDGASIPRHLALFGVLLMLLGQYADQLVMTVLGTVFAAGTPYLPAMGKYLHAAVLHDYLLTKGDRRYADREFLKALKAVGINWLLRWVMFLAVRGYSVVKGG